MIYNHCHLVANITLIPLLKLTIGHSYSFKGYEQLLLTI